MPKIGKWSRTLDVNDGATAYTVNQRGAGGIVDFQAGGVSKFSVTATAIVCGLPIAGGDQAWTDVGDITFHAGSILKSGGTNGNTLLIAANDTTFITLTTGTTDSCTIASPTITTPVIASLYQAAGGGLLSVPVSVGADTFCLIGATQELDGKTLDSSVAKGTWTASGTWTIPAVTLGGAVSGGGQALNAIGSIVFNASAATITTIATDGATFLLVAKNTAAQTQIVASVTGAATIANSTFDILVTPRFKAQSQSNYMTLTKAGDAAAYTVTFPAASFTVAGQNIDNAFSVDQTFAGNILFSTTAKGIYSVPSDAGTLLVVARNTAGQTQIVMTVQNAATVANSYITAQVGGTWTSVGTWTLGAFTAGGDITIGPLVLANDAGVVTLVDLPITATPAAGVEESYAFAIDAVNVLKIYGEADGAGAVKNKMIILPSESAKPDAAVGYRGGFLFEPGGAEVTDELYCCMKSAVDAYSWVLVAAGG